MLPIVPPCCDCSTGQTSFSKGKPVILIGMNGNIFFLLFLHIVFFVSCEQEIIVFVWNFRKIQPLPSISKLLLWKNLASDHKWSGWKWLLASHCQFWDLVLGGLVHHVWGSKNHCPRDVETSFCQHARVSYKTLRASEWTHHLVILFGSPFK